MKYVLKWITWILVVIGALNWGLIGFFNYNLVASLLPKAANVIYAAVGVSAVVLIVFKAMKMKGMKKRRK
ncbi:MAG: DUF378 domain-containing protein [Nanoarchaeota archaeon]|nr:DUF378 domain-containing protein [Nanoarchaeota archaeon]